MNRPAPSQDPTWPAVRSSSTRTAHPAHRQKPNLQPLSQDQAISEEEAPTKGMAEKSAEFIQTGAEVYTTAK